MKSVIWTIAIILSIAGMLILQNTTANVAKAYSCSSSTSTITGNSASTSVSGSSGGQISGTK